MEKISFKYADSIAVDDVSFKIWQGEIFGLIGSNGAGKSTIIRLLTTLLPITAGQISIKGIDAATFPSKIRQLIGYVPQKISADLELTAAENLKLSAKLYALVNYESKINDLLDFFDLTEKSDIAVKNFSGGMNRSLEIAQALLHEPYFLILDEPTIGLDPANRKKLWHLLKSLMLKKNLTVLITTHDMQEAEFLCDIVALMYRGKIKRFGSPGDLLKTHGTKASLSDLFEFNDLGDDG